MTHKIEFVDGVLKIYKESSYTYTPFQFPTWPSGTQWESEEQALEWGEDFVRSHLPDAISYPPLAPGFPRREKWL